MLSSSSSRRTMVEERLTAIEGRLDGLQADMIGVKSRLDGVETRLGGVETGLESLGPEMRAVLHETIDSIAALAPDFGPIRREFKDDDAKLRENVTQRLDPIEAWIRTRGRNEPEQCERIWLFGHLLLGYLEH